MRRWMTMVAIGLTLCCAAPLAAQPDRSGEVAALMAALDSPSRNERVNAAKKITQLGLTDTALYEKVAGQLRVGYAADIEANHVDEMAWLCKALAASGNTAYQGLLEEVAAQAPSPKLQKYASQSIAQFAEYQERNRVLNAADSYNAALTTEENRILSLLSADSSELKRDAAKMISRSGRLAEPVYDKAAAELLALVAGGQTDNLSIDTMAWLCKALAASGNGKYAAPLQQVITTAPNPKLVKFATNALKELN